MKYWTDGRTFFNMFTKKTNFGSISVVFEINKLYKLFFQLFSYDCNIELRQILAITMNSLISFLTWWNFKIVAMNSVWKVFWFSEVAKNYEKSSVHDLNFWFKNCQFCCFHMILYWFLPNNATILTISIFS